MPSPCSSSTRAMTPSRCTEHWRRAHARYSSACEWGGASTATLACATRRSTSDAPSPPTEDAVLRSEYLARALGRTPLQGCRLLSRARTSVDRATPQGPQPRGTRHSGTPAHRGWHAHLGRGRASAPGREEAGAEAFVAVVARAGGDNA